MVPSKAEYDSDHPTPSYFMAYNQGFDLLAPERPGGELHLYQCGKQTFNRRLFWNTEGPQMADLRLSHCNIVLLCSESAQ